jgi:transitional endoplasmic reticulum ATPase
MLALAAPGGPLRRDSGTSRLRFFYPPPSESLEQKPRETQDLGEEDDGQSLTAGEWVVVRPVLGAGKSEKLTSGPARETCLLCQAWPWDLSLAAEEEKSDFEEGKNAESAVPALFDAVSGRPLSFFCAADPSCRVPRAVCNQIWPHPDFETVSGSDSEGAAKSVSESESGGDGSGWLSAPQPAVVEILRPPEPIGRCSSISLRAYGTTQALSAFTGPSGAVRLSALVREVKQHLLRRVALEGCVYSYVGSHGIRLEAVSVEPAPPALSKIFSDTVVTIAGVVTEKESSVASRPPPQASASPSPQEAGRADSIWTEVDGEEPPCPLAGLQREFRRLVEMIAIPQRHADVVRVLLGPQVVALSRGALVHGPSGCGKSLLVQHVAKRTGAFVLRVSSAAVQGSLVGETERGLRDLFNRGRDLARRDADRPVLVVIRNIHELCPAASQGGDRPAHAARATSQLAALLDRAFTSPDTPNIFVVALASARNAVDSSICSPSRLDREVSVSAPDLTQRRQLLEVHLRHASSGDAGVAADCAAEIAPQLPGYTGADIRSLCREAMLSSFRAGQQRGDVTGVLPSAAHFALARGKVPASTQVHTVDVDRVRWDDIGGLGPVKRKLRQAVEWPLTRAEAFKRLHLRAPRGVLLHGPPGCSKTMMARAAASESHATFLSVSGASVFSQWVGDAEAAVRDVFARARLGTPAIVFLDEIEALVGSRETSGEGSDVHERVLTTLLNEMDGIEHCDGVMVLAATNRVDLVDEALLRPGRIDVLLEVPPPDRPGRCEILKIKSREMPLGSDTDLGALADKTEAWTGAELENLCREAALSALRRDISATEVTQHDFLSSLETLASTRAGDSG